jgi:hypothetical protein
MVRLLSDSLAESVRRSIEVADVTQDRAVVVQEIRIVRSALDGARDQGHAFRTPCLVQEQSEEMLCGDVIGLLGENSPIEGFGVCQPARLVQGQRLLDLVVQGSADWRLPARSTRSASRTLLSSQSPVYDRSAAFGEPQAGLSQYAKGFKIGEGVSRPCPKIETARDPKITGRNSDQLVS